MTLVAFAAAAIFGLMLAEQRVSTRHERALRAAGAIKPPGDPYWALAVTYPGAFLAMAVEGAWRSAHAGPEAGVGPSWAAAGVLLFAASKALKYWAIGTLRERWSFGVWLQPGRPLERGGPYQYLNHPNYIAVIGELLGTAMMMGAGYSGPISLVAFGAALAARLRFETRALAMLAPAIGGPDTSHGKGHS